MNDEQYFALTPINFFQLSWDCPQIDEKQLLKGAQYFLPDTSSLCGESKFADVRMAWNKEGIHVHVDVGQAFQKCVFPEVSQGDSIEIFIDTRDVKTSGFNTRFCHHFYFLPEAIDGHKAGEITRFRSEDAHELCNANDLKVTAQNAARKYSMKIFIPHESLVGYEPDRFNRLGFSYRINRYQGKPQHFSVVSPEFQIEQQPSLWSSFKLV